MAKKSRAEIRENYIHNRIVIIAPGRSKRPHVFKSPAPSQIHKKECPFCPEKINSAKAEYNLGGAKNWKVKVVKNKFPIVSKSNPDVYGEQDVIIETPEHDVELAELSVKHIASVLKVYGQRVKDLSKDKKINYILVFKNNGGTAGASIDHAHSQIFASEFIPPHVLEKLKRAEEYEIRRGECYYCRLINKELHGPRWIGHDSNVAAFTPYASRYNYEAWLLTRRHIDNVSDLNEKERLSMAKYLKKIIAKLNNINLPYNLYLHQVVHYKDEHLYFRICPRRATWAGLELGSRLIVNSVAPEEAAKFYREK
ncbi:DUF4931 domain-containing protein [Patescibacteria group bacterium]|nr:DUF4931 domain-containing protein [Patescibacteria group bacterium]MBU1891133.1 DUF4931 domain-containing protein [Patescibacteria group bacterium]